MATKLTLWMDESLIEEAKDYARVQGTSLSRLIARYLSSLKSSKKNKRPLSPIIEEISGILPQSIHRGSPFKAYRRHLEKKYR